MTPRFTASISSGTSRWQLLKPLPVSAMPTTGLSSIARE
jgi:lipopolysaccharide export LptBFGC system permease protein LptF